MQPRVRPAWFAAEARTTAHREERTDGWRTDTLGSGSGDGRPAQSIGSAVRRPGRTGPRRLGSGNRCSAPRRSSDRARRSPRGVSSPRVARRRSARAIRYGNGRECHDVAPTPDPSGAPAPAGARSLRRTPSAGIAPGRGGCPTQGAAVRPRPDGEQPSPLLIEAALAAAPAQRVTPALRVIRARSSAQGRVPPPQAVHKLSISSCNHLDRARARDERGARPIP